MVVELVLARARYIGRSSAAPRGVPSGQSTRFGTYARTYFCRSMMAGAFGMALREGPKPALTRRELEVAALVAEGLTNREIAKRLFISERTADGHLEHIREKLGVNSRAQIAAWFVDRSKGAPAGTLTPSRGPARASSRPAFRIAIAALTALLLLALVPLAYGRLARPAPAAGPRIDTFAGNSPPGNESGAYSGDYDQAASAQLSYPFSVASSRDSVYIADWGNNVIRSVDRKGIITTVAGGGQASFSEGANATSIKLPLQPAGVAVGPTAVAVAPGGRVFFCSGALIFRLDSDLTIHLVHLPDSAPPLQNPSGLAIDSNGTLYIADRTGNTVRKLTVDGSLSVYAGTGEAGFSGDQMAATGARLNEPTGLALDDSGNLFIADQGNNRVRKVNHLTGIIITVAGSGGGGFSGDNSLATRAMLSLPAGVAVQNGRLYIADTGNNRVRQVSKAGVISTLAGAGSTGLSGDGGPALEARFSGPWGLGLDGIGNLLVVDRGNHRVREIHLSSASP